MALTTYTFEMDETLKRQFEKMCETLGMNPSTAFNLFALKSVNDKRVFLEILEKNPNPNDLEKVKLAIEQIRQEAIKNGTCELTEEEIEAEIALARKERMK